MDLKDIIDHHHYALYGVVRGGANDPGAEDDMAPPIAMNEPIADLHGHSRDIVQQLVGPFAVCRGQVWQHEVVAAPAVHRLVTDIMTSWTT